jgi:lysophospholipase L1-like esterase
MSDATETTSRPHCAFLLLWGVPVLLLADTLVAAADGWRFTGTLERVFGAMLACWVLASLPWFFLAVVREWLGSLWREFTLLLAVVVIGWTALECVAHVLEASLRPDKPFHTRGPNLHNTVHPDPAYLPGIEGDSHFTTGPDGLRAAAPPVGGQSIRIITVGGSTTECVYLDDTETWPARLAAHLREPEKVWVGNAGISGFDLKDHLQFVDHSPALEGAAALVVQPGINDLWRYLAKEVETMDYGRFEQHLDAPSEPAPIAVAPYRPLWTRSRVIQLYHTLRQKTPPPEQQEGIGGREYQIRRDKRAAAEKTNELPSLAEGLALYRSRLEGLIAACQRRGVPVLFTTQPIVWRADLSAEAEARCWFGWLPDGRYLTLAALREAMDQYNEALKQTCATQGVPCVDLSPLNGSEAYFYDDCHFTEAGAEAVAQLAGPVLRNVIAQN